VIAQELAIRHPDLVRSLVLVSTWARVDAYFEAMGRAWRWMVTNAPTEREFLEAFFVWIYTRRAHVDGTVSQIVEESLAFPHAASAEAIQRTVDAFLAHETADRLPEISVPAFVLAGAEDVATPPQCGQVVADLIPGARFEVWDGEAHQPMQEAADRFNRRVADFWREADSTSRRSAGSPSGMSSQMRSLLSRFSAWVVSHPVSWGVGLGVVLALLSFALNLAPIVVIAAGAAIGVLNIVHAKRRGYCPRPAESGSQTARAEGRVTVPGGIQGETPDLS
jgi:hypothetical protein